MDTDNGVVVPPTTCPVTSGSGAGVEPPTAKGLPWLGVAHQLAWDKFTYASRISAEYGDIVRLPMPHKKPVYLVSNPDMVQQIFVKNAADVCKGAMLRGISFSVPGDPMATSEGESWRRLRKLAQPFFTNAGLKPLLPIMDEALDDHVASLEPYARSGETVNLEDITTVASFDVMMRVILDTKVSDKRTKRIAKYFRHFSEAGATRWEWFWLPRPVQHLLTIHKDIRAAPVLFEMLAMVREQMKHTSERRSLFGDMRDAKFDDGTTMTTKQLLAQMFTFVFAGFETTAAALDWTIALLALHPEARERAQAEASSLGRRPEYTDIDQFPYLRACFDEGQRIQGIPYYSRDTKIDVTLGGYHIPAGSVILCSPQAMQEDARYWDEPEKFKPERWLENKNKIDKRTYLAFGIGERRCIGVNMANIEGPLFLAKALNEYEFSVPKDWAPQHTFHMSTTIKDGVPVTIRRRH